jgi:2-octaprenyl-6-methoxyphenol hydroxylase
LTQLGADEKRFDADVIIVGGGPVGATLALALSQNSHAALDILVLEAQPDAVVRHDTRTLALSYGSRLILERVGIWQKLSSPTPITRIHISQRGSFGRALFSAEEVGVPALGYVIAHSELQSALHAALLQCGARYVRGASVTEVVPSSAAAQVHYAREGVAQSAKARLVALADGGRSVQNIPGIVRTQRDYHQTALVCQVDTELPHAYLAYERFTPEGPAALLPSGDRYALVWTATPARAQALLALSDAEFLVQLHTHFGDRQGRFLAATPRLSFPLSLHQSQPVSRERLVLIGNAAQMLHPVAGQGFNMGLRDAWELAQATLACAPDEIGGTAMLRRYGAARRVDTKGGIFFTDLLVRGFSNRLPGLRALRGLALSALDAVPPLKSFVVRRMIFGAKG